MKFPPDWLYCSMDWMSVPVTDMGVMKCVYQSDRRTYRDPTIIWGTTFDVQPLTKFVAAESRRANLFLSPAHALLMAVARSLREHPEFNRRMVGRSVHQFREVNLIMPMLLAQTDDVELVFLRGADQMSLRDLSRTLWTEAHERKSRIKQEQQRESERSAFSRFFANAALRLKLHWIRRMSWVAFFCHNHFPLMSMPWSQEFNAASAIVNVVNYPGAPSMQMFKPSALPINATALSVTMGPPEDRPAVVNGQIVIQRAAPLFLRMDHRFVHSHQIAKFLNTLCGYLTEPSRLVEGDSPNTEVHSAAA